MPGGPPETFGAEGSDTSTFQKLKDMVDKMAPDYVLQPSPDPMQVDAGSDLKWSEHCLRPYPPPNQTRCQRRSIGGGGAERNG